MKGNKDKNSQRANKALAFLRSIKYDPNYIYWEGEADKVKLSEEGFRDKLMELANDGYVESRGTKTAKRDWPLGSLRVDKSKFKMKLFVRQFDGKFVQYYCSAASADTSEKKKGAGGNAKKVLTSWLKDRGMPSMAEIYGRVSVDFKNCIPRGFYYMNRLMTDVPLDHMNAIDACSQYPSGFVGKMPKFDGESSKLIFGTAKPTEEYPFAFYINSGHLAIFGEFDTHDWLKTPFAGVLCPMEEKENPESKSIYHNYRLDPKRDMTVLMKAADSNPLEEFFKEQYSIKETKRGTPEYDSAKLVLNSLIGCMHYKDWFYRRSSFQFAHLAAVAIARGNEKILRKAMEIGVDNIAMIVVDGINYMGKTKFGRDEKSLGEFHQEAFDCEYQQLQMSVYMFMDGGKCVKYKHGAFDVDSDGNEIREPKCFAEMYGWKRAIKKDKKPRKEEEDGIEDDNQ